MLNPFITATLSILILVGTTRAEASYKLTSVWNTEPVLEVPESVLYYPADNLLYVSSISGKPAEKNRKGFISKVDLSGKVVELKWSTGLNAPKGMAIHGNSLYVSDIDELVQIDLETGTVKKRHPADGAVFLNDVAADKDGNIYVGDSSAENSKIYRLSQGKLEAWIEPPDIERPNGLYVQNDQLLAGHAGDGRLVAIDLKSRRITPVAKTDTGIDGLKPDGKGNYLTSNWAGRTSLITAEGKTIVLMDTTVSKINSADFEYLENQQLLLIPTFFDNRVSAYKMEYSANH
jgi:sugar lactone lactonase YvrE